MTENKTSALISKTDMATIVSGFIVVSGVVLKALGLVTDDIIIGGGLGFLFGVTARKTVKQ